MKHNNKQWLDKQKWRKLNEVQPTIERKLNESWLTITKGKVGCTNSINELCHRLNKHMNDQHIKMTILIISMDEGIEEPFKDEVLEKIKAKRLKVEIIWIEQSQELSVDLSESMP